MSNISFAFLHMILSIHIETHLGSLFRIFEHSKEEQHQKQLILFNQTHLLFLWQCVHSS